jgi:hypothetical protein
LRQAGTGFKEKRRVLRLCCHNQYEMAAQNELVTGLVKFAPTPAPGGQEPSFFSLAN